MKKKPLIVAFLAKAGSGKTTAAEHLIEKYQDVERISFAGPLKIMAQALFKFSEAQLYGDQKEVIDPRYDATPRQLLQLLGAKARECIG